MYVIGIKGQPHTYIAHEEWPVTAACLAELAKAYPRQYLTLLSLPGVSLVYVVGVHGKLDHESFYTTFEEVQTHRFRLTSFFSPRELYDLCLTPEDTTPAAEALHLLRVGEIPDPAPLQPEERL